MSFWHHFLTTVWQPHMNWIELDAWLQSYEQFISTENNIKQKYLNPFFANISKTISATSDSIPLIMVWWWEEAWWHAGEHHTTSLASLTNTDYLIHFLIKSPLPLRQTMDGRGFGYATSRRLCKPSKEIWKLFLLDDLMIRIIDELQCICVW